MKLTEIQDLIRFVAKAGVNEVEIEQKDFKIVIKSDYLAKKKSNLPGEQAYVPVVPAPVAAPVVQAVAAPIAPEAPAAAPKPVVSEESNYITIKSQMIGTFYRSPSPDKPVFKEVGDTIKVGDTICIVEAMKLFNEIESEVSGKLVKVLIDDASPVEFDQPLFLIDPA